MFGGRFTNGFGFSGALRNSSFISEFRPDGKVKDQPASSPTYANTYYVRQGATGSGNGSDWDNAFTSLPSVLTRDSIYYIADGNYSSYDFNDAEDGTKYIEVRKATESDHGTDTGWNSAYGDGVAEFAPAIFFTTGYYIFNGNGGGNNSWYNGHGFYIETYSHSFIMAIYLSWGASGVSNITISGVRSSGPYISGESTGIYSIKPSSNITIRNCYFDGHGSGHMRVHYATNWVVEYNVFAETATTGSGSHGSGITFWYDCTNVQVRYNRFRAILGTGYCGIYRGFHEGWKVYGNVFHNQGASASNGIIYDTVGGGTGPTGRNWVIAHNTFYDMTGIPLIGFYGTDGGNRIAYNNVAYGCDGNFLVGITGLNNVKLGEDFFVNGPTGDCHLTGETPTGGTTLGSPYNVDPDGETRGQGSVIDLGAYEYV